MALRAQLVKALLVETLADLMVVVVVELVQLEPHLDMVERAFPRQSREHQLHEQVVVVVEPIQVP
jgi:hypothetical protein